MNRAFQFGHMNTWTCQVQIAATIGWIQVVDKHCTPLAVPSCDRIRMTHSRVSTGNNRVGVENISIARAVLRKVDDMDQVARAGIEQQSKQLQRVPSSSPHVPGEEVLSLHRLPFDQRRR